MVHIYFNPQGPRGPRLIGVVCIYPDSLFQSTRPSRASTTSYRLLLMRCLFQSTRPSRASTCALNRDLLLESEFQSTRPSRASTYDCGRKPAPQKFQSTRPSRASTFRFHVFLQITILFQSTRPSRASTPFCRRSGYSSKNFNPQGPRGPRHSYKGVAEFIKRISIHKALAGLDELVIPLEYWAGISIHKALAGLDDTGQIVYGGH